MKANDQLIFQIFTFVKDRYSKMLAILLVAAILSYYAIIYFLSLSGYNGSLLYMAHKNKVLTERIALLSSEYVVNGHNANYECIEESLATDLALLKSSNKALACAQKNSSIVSDRIEAIYLKEAMLDVERYIALGDKLLKTDESYKGEELGKILNQIYGSLQVDLERLISAHEFEKENIDKLLNNTEKILSVIIWLIIISTIAKYLVKFEIKNTKKKILIVEDNRVARGFIEQIVESEGYFPILASNGQEALDILEQNRNFTLIFMDCEMPIMGGFEATKNIRQIEVKNGLPAIPVVALTANSMQRDKENCISAGMDDFLTKPINPSELKDIIKKWSSKS